MSRSFFNSFWVGLMGLCLLVALPAEAKDRRHKISGLPVAELRIVGSGHAPYVFTVEIADDEAERSTGLMYRRALPRDQGMLFEFEDEAPRNFWMRNTYIPLDIIYIDAKGVIVSIQKSAKPFDETPLPSAAPAKAALEVVGGLSDRLGIRPGDKIEYGLFKAR
jgi:uncharacterized protein